MKQDAPVLLTGATGYVGGRLLRVLQGAGGKVRCLARHPEDLRDAAGERTEIVAGDVLDPASVAKAMEGVESAYYLVHSMDSAGSFEEEDRRAAENFAAAARSAGVRRIVYLGGLGDGDGKLSAHLRSRQEVGEVLRAGGVPVIEFRASMVIGAGSLSFEMLRALVERLPVMIAPRWVAVAAQPIAIGDLLSYLLSALDIDPEGNPIFEIGGADQVSYGDLMREYARQRGLKRWIVPVPVLSPRLSSLWLGLVTPVYVRVGRKLIDSIRHPTVVMDTSAGKAFDIRPVGYREAIATALADEDREFASTPWSKTAFDKNKTSSRLIDTREARVNVSPEKAFAPIRRIGGKVGWYYANSLWRIRGAMDTVAGGVGLRRGRRDPEELLIGDAVDFWRVEAFEPNRRLRLAAEMKVWGRAWLEFEVTGGGDSSVIRQTAVYDPKGLIGRAYWYSVYPLHRLVFAGMLRNIAKSSGR